MTEAQQPTTKFEAVLTDLAASRGISSIEELAERANAEADYAMTAEEFRDPGVPMGYGRALDAVLALSE